MSPKVWVPAALQIVAGIILAIVTGNWEALVITLTGITTGGIGFAAPVLSDDGQGTVTMQQVKDARHLKHGGKLPPRRKRG